MSRPYAHWTAVLEHVGGRIVFTAPAREKELAVRYAARELNQQLASSTEHCEAAT